MKNKKIILSSGILATALLGANFANSINDVRENNEIIKTSNENRGASGETEGIYGTWLHYKSFGDAFGGSTSEAYLNYKLEKDESTGDLTYILGVILNTSSYSNAINGTSASGITMSLRDLNSLDDKTETDDPNAPQGKPEDIMADRNHYFLKYDNKWDIMNVPTTAEEWPFSLTSQNIFGKDPSWGTGNVYNFTIEIPLSETPYEWEGGTINDHIIEGMHEESNFVVEGITVSGDAAKVPGTGQNYLSLKPYDWKSTTDSNVTEGANILSNRDKALWLRFPRPKATIDSISGDLSSGYDVDFTWDHTPTPLDFSTVSEIKYTMTGPESKTPDSSMQIWDEWVITDEGATHRYRNSVTDSTIIEDEVIPNDGSATGDLAKWMDGTSDGDINIAGNQTDSSITGGEALSQRLHYGTDYLFTGAGQDAVNAPPAYNVEFSVTGEHTTTGFDNSFVWDISDPFVAESAMNTASYEPEVPVLKSDIAISTAPAHDADGKITTAIDFSIDGKGEDDFDGSGYTPSGVYKVEIVDSADSNKAYGSVDVTPDSKGDVSGTVVSTDLPANKHMELALKIYYGHNGYGETNESIQTNNELLMGTTLPIDTTVRGSVDKTAALAQNTIDSDTVTVDLDINDIAWDGQSYAVADYASADIVSITIDDVKNVRPDSDDKKQWTVDPASLDAEGKTTVTLDGLYPNTDYEFVTTVVYKGESSTTSNGITEAEDDRTITSNTVAVTSNTLGVAAPKNVKITLGEPVILDNRQIKYDYTIDMDVASEADIVDEYDPTLVSEIRVYINDSLNLTLKEGVDWNEEDLGIVEGNEKPEHLTVSGTLTDIQLVGAESTVRTEIDYAGGTYSDAPTQTINPHDRGISDIIISDPEGVAVNDDGLTHRLEFSGTVKRSLPAGTSGQATDVTQFATNTYDKIEIIDVATGMVIATGDASAFTPTAASKNEDISNTADVDYKVTSEVLNPNKQYDVYAKVYYTTDSTMTEFKGETAMGISTIVDGSNGETDADPVTDPLLTIEAQPVVTLDNSTRNFTVNGTILLDTVGQDEYNANNSAELPTDVTLIELVDAADGTTVFASHEVTDEERKASEIRWDWTINEDKLLAKTSYDLEVRATHAGGTKTYDSDVNHIKFDVGSRGELQYTGIVVEELKNEIGPKLTLGLNPTYYVNEEGDFETIGHEYADYDLAKVNNIGVRFEFMQDIDYVAGGAWKDPSFWDDWKGEEYIYEDHEEHIYNGESIEIPLGIEELIQKMPFGPVGTGDSNGNDKDDTTYWYKFTIEADVTTGEGEDQITERYSYTNDDTMIYNQMDFEKGPYTAFFRNNEIDPVAVDYDNETASVTGRFWIENRPDDFYLNLDIYEDTEITDYYELGMWGTGIETVKLYDVTGLEPDADGEINPTEENVIQDFSSELSTFVDSPDSFKDTSNSNEAHTEFETWLAGEHSMKEFTIDGLTPGQSYSFQVVTHYNGDPDGTHNNGTDPWDGEGVNPEGYDSVWEFDVAVPTLGERQLLQEDVQFTSAKSSLTSWTLGYAVAPLTEDDRYDKYIIERTSIVKDYVNGVPIDEQNIVTSVESTYDETDDSWTENAKQGNLVVEGMVPGQSPVDSNWSIVIETTGGQVMDIALTEDWLTHGGPDGGVIQTVDGEDLASVNTNPLAPEGDNYNWLNTPKGQTETWDLNEPLIADDWKATEITEEGFILSASKGESYDDFVRNEILNESTLKVVDIATGEELNSTLMNPVSKAAGTISIQVSGLENSTVYGEKGFDISFEVVDPNAPTAIEGGVPLVISETGVLRIETLNKFTAGQIIGITVGVSASILIPLILVLLFLFWLLILVRKVKETEIVDESVTFTINRKPEFKDRLKGAKLQDKEGKKLTFTLSDIEDKVAITVKGYEKNQQPIKGLKFEVNNSSVDAENEKLNSEFETATKEYEANMKVYEADVAKWEKAVEKWNEDKKKAAETDKEFTKEKPAKPVAPEQPKQPKLVKPFKDVSIFGSIKTITPAEEEAIKAEKEAEKAKAKEEAEKAKAAANADKEKAKAEAAKEKEKADAAKAKEKAKADADKAKVKETEAKAKAEEEAEKEKGKGSAKKLK